MGFFGDVAKVFSNPVRAAEAVGTFGTSEIARSALGGIDPLSIAAPIGVGVLTGNPGAGMSLAGGIYGAQMQARSVQEQNAINMQLAQQQMMWSAQQAQQQMAFQERMSSSSIQRAKADMLAAGINPMLAPTAQESSPSGSMGSYTRANVEAVPAVAMNAMNTAKEWISMLQTLKQSDADIRNKAADVSLKGAEEANIRAQTPGSSAKSISAEADAWAARNRNKVERAWPKTFGWTDAIMSRIGGMVNSAVNAVTSGIGGFLGAKGAK